MKKQFLTLAFIVANVILLSQTQINFPSTDKVTVYGNLYESTTKDAKIMLLCHQAGYSRGEYNETAPKFNTLGYTCLAIDQRSGETVNNVTNLTAADAKSKNLPTTYLDAEQDIIAAVNYLFAKYGKKIILVGSSYSSSLIIKVAASQTQKVESIISFSPGEYFDDQTLITNNLKQLTIPVYITCAKDEISDTQKLMIAPTSKNITFFKPKQAGKHGSKALWAKNSNNKEYWDSLLNFLKSN